MELFSNEEINITKIYSVEKYERNNSEPNMREFGTYFYSYELVYFISGENKTTVGGVTMRDCPGSLRFMPKGQSKGKYIVKSAPGANKCIDIYFDSDSPMPSIPMGLYNNKSLEDKFLKLFGIWHRKRPGYYTASMTIFYDIISSIKQMQQRYISNPQRERMQKAYDYILKNYRLQKFDYRELCRTTELEYTYFSEIFKKTYNMSPARLVTAMRIGYAKELLISRRYSVSEIAEMCGFENVYYFSAVFKKLTGLPPSKYRG